MVYFQWHCTVLGAFGQFVLEAIPSLPLQSLHLPLPFPFICKVENVLKDPILPHIEFQQVSGEIKVSNVDVSRAVGAFRRPRLRYSCQLVTVTSQHEIDREANI